MMTYTENRLVEQSAIPLFEELNLQSHPDDPVNVPANVPVKTEGLSERRQWFMEQLSAGKKVKAADIEAQWNVVENTAKRDIAELRKLELVEFVWAAKTGGYRLKLPGKGR